MIDRVHGGCSTAADPVPEKEATPVTVLITCLVLGVCQPTRGGEAIGPDRGGQAVPLTNVEIGHDMAARRGWVGRQFDCLYRLWSRESGWVTTKANYAGSGAYGIPQALPGSKMASAGPLWRTDAATQIRWGLGYIAARYGDPCGAWANSNSYGYY